MVAGFITQYTHTHTHTQAYISIQIQMCCVCQVLIGQFKSHESICGSESEVFLAAITDCAVVKYKVTRKLLSCLHLSVNTLTGDKTPEDHLTKIYSIWRQVRFILFDIVVNMNNIKRQ